MAGGRLSDMNSNQPGWAMMLAAALWSGGATAFGTYPPSAATWWQPAQWSVNSANPRETLPRSGCGCGIPGPLPSEATYATSASICCLSNGDFVWRGWA